MCLLVLAWQVHPRYRLVVAANRDEFHNRPAAPLSRWPAPDDILAGRDLRANGTWLGVDRRRRFGVVTNFRDLQPPRPNAPSRGDLIPRFLTSPGGAAAFIADLEEEAPGYSGFNLLLADDESLWYASNRAEGFARALPPGVYGLSNEFLDAPWPKLRRVRQRFESWLSDSAQALSDGTSRGRTRASQDTDAAATLFALLDDRVPASTEEGLPQTGLSPEWERTLSSPFVLHPEYGTRCSTVVTLEPSGRLYMAERRFDARGQSNGQTEFQLNASEWPGPLRA